MPRQWHRKTAKWLTLTKGQRLFSAPEQQYYSPEESSFLLGRSFCALTEHKRCSLLCVSVPLCLCVEILQKLVGYKMRARARTRARTRARAGARDLPIDIMIFLIKVV